MYVTNIVMDLLVTLRLSFTHCLQRLSQEGWGHCWGSGRRPPPPPRRPENHHCSWSRSWWSCHHDDYDDEHFEIIWSEGHGLDVEGGHDDLLVSKHGLWLLWGLWYYHWFLQQLTWKVNVVVMNDVIKTSNGNLSGEKNTGSTEVDLHCPQIGSVHRTAVENWYLEMITIMLIMTMIMIATMLENMIALW